jgi:leucine dehydrogenase
MYPYANEQDALYDVLRLSKGMTYKAAISGINSGGGKAVIIADPKTQTNEVLFRSFGKFVNSLGGKYITAEDVGTSAKCMEWIHSETKYVTGIPAYFGGTGDPSPVTAHGVFVGIKASLKKAKGSDSLRGVKIGIEGAAGHVGSNLCRELYEQGAILFVSDIQEEPLKKIASEYKATIVKPGNLCSMELDVYAPCALGAIINDATIPKLKCAIIAGAANNQLKEEAKHSDELKKMGILYAPDYVINAGGLLNVYSEVAGGGTKHAWEKTENIYNTLLHIFDIADKNIISTAMAAAQIAEKRINDVSSLNLW